MGGLDSVHPPSCLAGWICPLEGFMGFLLLIFLNLITLKRRLKKLSLS